MSENMMALEARQRAMAPRLEHGRILQERAEELGSQYRDLEMQLYDIRRGLLYILPDLEKCRRFLEEIRKAPVDQLDE